MLLLLRGPIINMWDISPKRGHYKNPDLRKYIQSLVKPTQNSKRLGRRMQLGSNPATFVYQIRMQDLSATSEATHVDKNSCERKCITTSF